MTTASAKHFPDALRDLMAERDISFRKLAIQTGRYRERPYSLAMLSQWMNGERRPTVEAVEIVARAAGVNPTYFREYREHVAAEEAKRLANEVGLDEVLAKLRELAV